MVGGNWGGGRDEEGVKKGRKRVVKEGVDGYKWSQEKKTPTEAVKKGGKGLKNGVERWGIGRCSKEED